MKEGWYYKVTSGKTAKEYGPFVSEADAKDMREFTIGWMHPTDTVSAPYYKKDQ